MSDVMLSIGETAKLMGVCENTLRNWDLAGSFVAERTQGEHRRYSLDQIRAYLDKQAGEKAIEVEKSEVKNETNNTKLVERWEASGHLTECYGAREKETLAILLENASLYMKGVCCDDYISSDQMIWLTQQGWNRSKLRKTVSIHAMQTPCDLVYYVKSSGKIEDVAVCAATKKYFFSIFHNTNWDNIKDAYANAIAAEIDYDIYMRLPRISLENALKAGKSFTSMKELYDYVVGPVNMIEEARQLDSFQGVDLYPMPTVLDDSSFDIVQCGGKYHNGCKPPIFCPYILAMVGPMIRGCVSSVLTRYAWFEG